VPNICIFNIHILGSKIVGLGPNISIFDVQKALCTVRPVSLDVQRTLGSEAINILVPKKGFMYPTLQITRKTRKSNVFETFCKWFGMGAGCR